MGVDRTNSAGFVLSPARSQGLCSGVSPGLCSLGARPCLAAEGHPPNLRWRSALALRRSPLLVTLPAAGTWRFLSQGFPPVLLPHFSALVSAFCAISCAFLSGYFAFPVSRTGRETGMRVLYHKSVPLNSPGFVNFLAGGKRAGPFRGPRSSQTLPFLSPWAAGRRFGSAPGRQSSLPPSAPGACRCSGPGTGAGR